MIQQGTISTKPYNKVFVLTFVTFIKLLYFHQFIGINQRYWLITILNGVTVFGIYQLVSMTAKKNKRRALLITHFLISLLLFSNSLYFSHFATLMPIHIFNQVKHLKGVSSSVSNLMQLKYLLFFIDSLLIWFIQWKFGSNPIQRFKRKTYKDYLVLMVAILVVLGSCQGLFGNIKGYYTPFNLGMVNYHLYDIVDFLKHKLPLVEAYEETWNEVLPEEDMLEEENKQFFGVAEGKNVIIIQAESLQSFVLQKQVNGQWITPVLNGLIDQETLYFPRYYEQVGWGNTSDAEFVSQTGYHASTKNYSFKQYEGKSLITLPKVLKEQDYKTVVFHGNEASFWNRDNIYPDMGIDEFISLEYLMEEEIIGMGIGDRSLFRQSIPHLKTLDEPFYSYFITLTSHYPFHLEAEYCNLDVGEPYQDTVVGGYFQTVNYLDKAIGEFIQSLKDTGIYENSIIIIYGDHHGLKAYNEETSHLMTEFLGKEYREDEMLRVPLLIHIPNGDVKEEINTVGGQVDFFPTLANLLGLSINNYKFIGKDLLNTKDNYAINMIRTAKGSFFKDDYIFSMSKDGMFENSTAWNVYTGEPIDLDVCSEGYERAMAEIQLSEFVLENEFILIKEGNKEEDYNRKH